MHADWRAHESYPRRTWRTLWLVPERRWEVLCWRSLDDGRRWFPLIDRVPGGHELAHHDRPGAERRAAELNRRDERLIRLVNRMLRPSC